MARKKEVKKTIETTSTKKKKKWENPHKREYGIEIVKRQEDQDKNIPIEHKISIDIGFTTSGLTHLDTITGKIKTLYYKKDTECHVKGAGIIYLTKLCRETLQKYWELFPQEIKDNPKYTQIILEEPLVIAGQKSFSISLYVLLHYLITKFLLGIGVHSVVLVRPGSAKKLLGYSQREKMKDGVKTAWLKENLPEWCAKNNHISDSCFSMILTNYDFLASIYPNVNLLNKIDYKVYESYL